MTNVLTFSRSVLLLLVLSLQVLDSFFLPSLTKFLLHCLCPNAINSSQTLLEFKLKVCHLVDLATDSAARDNKQTPRQKLTVKYSVHFSNRAVERVLSLLWLLFICSPEQHCVQIHKCIIYHVRQTLFESANNKTCCSCYIINKMVRHI